MRRAGPTNSLVDVAGLRVGHAQRVGGGYLTGTTVILTPADGAVGGVDVRGAAPGTRETELLDPRNLVERVHAVVLSGGSAFGLSAACGVMSRLAEAGVGYPVAGGAVPIVPAAVIFDLGRGGTFHATPDATLGTAAYNAATAPPPPAAEVPSGEEAGVVSKPRPSADALSAPPPFQATPTPTGEAAASPSSAAEVPLGGVGAGPAAPTGEAAAFPPSVAGVPLGEGGGGAGEAGRLAGAASSPSPFQGTSAPVGEGGDVGPSVGATPSPPSFEGTSALGGGVGAFVVEVRTAAPTACGSVGAGTGAMAGGLAGGVGTASVVLADGTTVAALAVVNAVGSVLDPHDGTLAGTRYGLPGEFDHLRTPTPQETEAWNPRNAPAFNTTIGVVATDRTLTKAKCGKLAAVAHDGLARAIRPAHTMTDGDTIFALATCASGAPGHDIFQDVLAAGADVFSRAVAHAILAATGREGAPAYLDVFPSALRKEP
ncbi:P1 family peptidase [Nonomuraea sp. NPDC050643]|uniref:P1 family peptidase n=1 Tax=Nonomuraea sp. NPDC050643 TaxID=3155660 RepID=UPI0033EBBD46